jgi:hypothetical protein
MDKLISTLLTVFTAVCAQAVILAGGDGTQNTSAPAGGQGWDYVGRITSANGAPSGVTYISNNWFITANHIKELDNPTGVILGGSAYSIDPNSWTRLQNSTGGDADLIMFRVVGASVGLPGLAVRSSNLANNSALTMIGNGRNRETDETHWWETDGAWSETTFGGNRHGYKWASGATKRWGTNKKDANAGLVDDGFGITDVFRTDFDDSGGSEAQGATYDSGGGVFYNNGGDWELVGIMILTTEHGDQPGSSAVYGNRTYVAHMQYYADQIAETAQIDDLDEDGIPDGWEYGQTGSTTGVVATVDQDGDGFDGTMEWITDTNPIDSNSFLRVLAYTNAVSLTFTSSTNRKYEVQFRTDLTHVSWSTEIAWTNGLSGQTVKPVSVSSSNRFYRVRAQLP